MLRPSGPASFLTSSFGRNFIFAYNVRAQNILWYQHCVLKPILNFTTLWANSAEDKQFFLEKHIVLTVLATCLLLRIFARTVKPVLKTCLFKYAENFTTKNRKFSDKNSDTFHNSAQNIDCGYSWEPPRRCGSHEYPQSMFLSRN